METKTFGGKEIVIRKIRFSDLFRIRRFQNFINSLIDKKANILANKKMTVLAELRWLRAVLIGIYRKKNQVYLIAEHKNRVIGITSVRLLFGKSSHIGDFAISVSNDFRRIGLGYHLAEKIIDLAKKELKSTPEIISLEVFANNQPAIALYQKVGFDKVAIIPNKIKQGSINTDAIIMHLYI